MLGILGLGTVGQGVVKLLQEYPDEALSLKTVVVRNLHKPRAVQLEGVQITDDPQVLLTDPDISIVLECTGHDDAYGWIKQALTAKKHVITAHKACVSQHLEELSALAEENGVTFYYEAAVMAGVPVIKPLLDQIRFNSIDCVEGILNGTTNFMLTHMATMGYDNALAEAQRLGYAEQDPTADVGGFDAGRKLRILATLAFRGPVTEDMMQIKGIQDLSAADLAFFAEEGYQVKLLGRAVQSGGGVSIYVAPTALPLSHPMAQLTGTENMAGIYGSNVGPLFIQGRGAGMRETAVGMLTDAARIAHGMAPITSPLGHASYKAVSPQGRAFLHVPVGSPWESLVERDWGPGQLTKPISMAELRDFPHPFIWLEDEALTRHLS